MVWFTLEQLLEVRSSHFSTLPSASLFFPAAIVGRNMVTMNKVLQLAQKATGELATPAVNPPERQMHQSPVILSHNMASVSITMGLPRLSFLQLEEES